MSIEQISLVLEVLEVLLELVDNLLLLFQSLLQLLQLFSLVLLNVGTLLGVLSVLERVGSAWALHHGSSRDRESSDGLGSVSGGQLSQHCCT